MDVNGEGYTLKTYLFIKQIYDIMFLIIVTQISFENSSLNRKNFIQLEIGHFMIRTSRNYIRTF